MSDDQNRLGDLRERAAAERARARQGNRRTHEPPRLVATPPSPRHVGYIDGDDVYPIPRDEEP
jgi:hypothetical protein